MYNLTLSTIYIIISDCDCFKKQIKNNLESLLDTQVLLEEAPALTLDEFCKTHIMKSIADAVNEASHAGFFVISQNPGIGRQMVARAQKFNEAFWGSDSDQCDAQDFHAIANGWSGL